MKIKFELKPHFFLPKDEINILLDAMAILENAAEEIPYQVSENLGVTIFLEKAEKVHSSINDFLDFVEEE